MLLKLHSACTTELLAIKKFWTNSICSNFFSESLQKIIGFLVEGFQRGCCNTVPHVGRILLRNTFLRGSLFVFFPIFWFTIFGRTVKAAFYISSERFWGKTSLEKRIFSLFLDCWRKVISWDLKSAFYVSRLTHFNEKRRKIQIFFFGFIAETLLSFGETFLWNLSELHLMYPEKFYRWMVLKNSWTEHVSIQNIDQSISAELSKQHCTSPAENFSGKNFLKQSEVFFRIWARNFQNRSGMFYALLSNYQTTRPEDCF